MIAVLDDPTGDKGRQVSGHEQALSLRENCLNSISTKNHQTVNETQLNSFSCMHDSRPREGRIASFVYSAYLIWTMHQPHVYDSAFKRGFGACA